jgi:carboxypeptidase C (cathepsin A)
MANCSKRPEPAVIPEVANIYNTTWYSGYLDFSFEKYTAHMHYFYFPSQSNTSSSDKDPVLFWFNGGPGCSSLLGALYEHGPFIFNDNFGIMVANPEAWNKRAHTIYI